MVLWTITEFVLEATLWSLKKIYNLGCYTFSSSKKESENVDIYELMLELQKLREDIKKLEK